MGDDGDENMSDEELEEFMRAQGYEPVEGAEDEEEEPEECDENCDGCERYECLNESEQEIVEDVEHDAILVAKLTTNDGATWKRVGMASPPLRRYLNWVCEKHDLV